GTRGTSRICWHSCGPRFYRANALPVFCGKCSSLRTHPPSNAAERSPPSICCSRSIWSKSSAHAPG
ncbi:uncharacterized protein METZ01_LOCUS331465, partial [marine metagenome]